MSEFDLTARPAEGVCDCQKRRAALLAVGVTAYVHCQPHSKMRDETPAAKREYSDSHGSLPRYQFDGVLRRHGIAVVPAGFVGAAGDAAGYMAQLAGKGHAPPATEGRKGGTIATEGTPTPAEGLPRGARKLQRATEGLTGFLDYCNSITAAVKYPHNAHVVAPPAEFATAVDAVRTAVDAMVVAGTWCLWIDTTPPQLAPVVGATIELRPETREALTAEELFSAEEIDGAWRLLKALPDGKRWIATTSTGAKRALDAREFRVVAQPPPPAGAEEISID